MIPLRGRLEYAAEPVYPNTGPGCDCHMDGRRAEAIFFILGPDETHFALDTSMYVCGETVEAIEDAADACGCDPWLGDATTEVTP